MAKRSAYQLIIKMFKIVSILAFVCGGFWYFDSARLSQFSEWIEFRKGKVQNIQKDGFHALAVDQCATDFSHVQPGTGCSCVALAHDFGGEARVWKKILLWTAEDWAKMGFHRKLRLFAVDLPGSGLSSPPSSGSGYRIRNQAEVLRGWLAPYCSEWTVVGQGWGGAIAMWLALDWPQGVSRLVLLGSAGVTQKNSEVLKNLTDPSANSLNELQRQSQTEEDRLDVKMSALRQPIVLFWGKDDHVIPIEIGYQMRELLKKNMIWREATNCGHLAQLECPTGVVQSIIDMINFGAI